MQIAVLGGGGYLGAITFGFLQRAGSLYGTGIDRNCRCLGATGTTAVALNGMLSKHFILAQADESFIQLTDFSNIDNVVKNLQGIDALIMGTELTMETRPVTAGTYEKTPNDKTLEIYWDTKRGSGETKTSSMDTKVQPILENILKACEKSDIQHIVAISNSNNANNNNNNSFLEKLKSSSIPCSLLQYSGELFNCQNYNYQKGLQNNLQLNLLDKDETLDPSTNTAAATMYREDLAALAIQSLLSLDWSQSRNLAVTSKGPLVVEESVSSKKRPDQCWCVNSHILEAKLNGL